MVCKKGKLQRENASDGFRQRLFPVFRGKSMGRALRFDGCGKPTALRTEKRGKTEGIFPGGEFCQMKKYASKAVENRLAEDFCLTHCRMQCNINK
ncbi:MAG: hypothetical protein IKK78_02085 [Oscillospiraceae bacterium]|nr:hypothetical protein [Oscillospiraceae bacterium]